MLVMTLILLLLYSITVMRISGDFFLMAINNEYIYQSEHGKTLKTLSNQPKHFPRPQSTDMDTFVLLKIKHLK